jgi:hypothetical protein
VVASRASATTESLSHYREPHPSSIPYSEALEEYSEVLEESFWRPSMVASRASATTESLSHHREPQPPSRASATIESLSHHQEFHPSSIPYSEALEEYAEVLEASF